MDIKLKDANGEHQLDEFSVDEPCVVSFFIGELGWLLQRWQSYLRHLKHNIYPDHKFLMMLNGQYHVIVQDFVNWSIDLPKEFYNLNLETDCYEAPFPESPAGSLTPSEVWVNLIEYFRQFYNVEKAVEIWTPRGANTWVDFQPQLFTKYTTEAVAGSPKPIITVFPRGRSRASFRNVPEQVWYETVEELRKHFSVILCGTPSGSYLVNYQAPNVENLIGKADLEKVMFLLNNSAFSISSQSGPTHISVLSMCPAYIIGHEQKRHTVDDNKFNTPTSFRYVADYRAIDAQTIVKDVFEFMQLLKKHNEFDSIGRRLSKPSTQWVSIKNKDIIGVIVGLGNPAMIGNTVNLLDVKRLYLVGKPSDYDQEAIQNLTIRLDEFNNSDKIHWVTDEADNINDELDFVYIEDPKTPDSEIKKYYDKLKAGGVLGGQALAEFEKRSEITAYRKVYTGIEGDIHNKFDPDAPQTGWFILKGGVLRDSMVHLKGKKNLVGAEIGVYLGDNSKGILDNLDIKKLYLIDPYNKGLVGLEEEHAPRYIQNAAHNTLSPHSDKIEWIKKKSQDAAEDIPDNSLDFAYVDGDHTYEGAKIDLELYWPKVKEGGILAGHDFDNEHIARAVTEYFEDKNIAIFSGVDIDGTLEFWIHKIENFDAYVVNEGLKALDKIIKKRQKEK